MPGMTKTSKVRVGSGKNAITVWMDGPAHEVVDRITNRFKVYETRPTKKADGKVSQPKKAKTEAEPVAS